MTKLSRANRLRLAEYPLTAPQVLERLALDRPDLTNEVRRLEQAGSFRIRRAVVLNPSTPRETIELLARTDPNVYIRRLARGRLEGAQFTEFAGRREAIPRSPENN